MPTYIFECSCGYKLEANIPMAERNLKRSCPSCDKILKRGITKANLPNMKGGSSK